MYNRALTFENVRAAAAAVEGGAALAAQAALESQMSLVLPNLVKLVRSIHKLWDPAVRAMLPPVWQNIVYRPVEYEAAVEGAVGATAIASIVGVVSAQGEDERRAMDLCGWLRHVRDGAYQLLGVLASLGPDSALYMVLV
jgi:exportin-5